MSRKSNRLPSPHYSRTQLANNAGSIEPLGSAVRNGSVVAGARGHRTHPGGWVPILRTATRRAVPSEIEGHLDFLNSLTEYVFFSPLPGNETPSTEREMPKAEINGVNLYYEECGEGLPLLFVHEWGGDHRSWEPQVRFFARRYRVITFNARGYPPSAVPQDVTAYSQRTAVDDIKGVLDHLAISKAHVCGLSMGAYATLVFGLTYPDRALSLAVAGGGYGSGMDRDAFRKTTIDMAERLEREGSAAVAATYARGPARVQFLRKDPRGWQEFHDQLSAGSALGRAMTLRGVQMTRPSFFELDREFERLFVPVLVMVGDEDDLAIEPSVFLKRKAPAAGLVMLPNSGHTINLEEPDLFNHTLLDFLTAVDAGRWPNRQPAH
jgi:pimeloyl-ACP methyl ester carboxylesterase